jgi:hypothetical protein
MIAGEEPLYKVLIFAEGKFDHLADEELELYEAVEIVEEFNRIMIGGRHWAALTEQDAEIGVGK